MAGYGAAAKGNTFLNFSGIKSDLISYVCDSADSKQGTLLPGSGIPVVSPQINFSQEPVDYAVIFPWNIAEEIWDRIKAVAENSPEVVTFVPSLRQIT